MYRLRVRFKRGERVKYISHLDLIRLWQRALHRAALPLAYSEGYSPHPRISLAAPLSIGVTSEAELMDVHLSRMVSPHYFQTALSSQLPPDIEITQVILITAPQPSLQAQIRFAEYRVTVASELAEDEVRENIDQLIARDKIPWQHYRDTGPRNYDLRPLISEIDLDEYQPDECTLSMRLRCDSSGSGRPEQVALALGFQKHPHAIHRTRLILNNAA